MSKKQTTIVQTKDYGIIHQRETDILPSPEDLQRYKDTDPRVVELFINHVQKEQEVRHELERSKIELEKSKINLYYRESSNQRLGLYLAFFSVVLIISLTALAIIYDSTWLAIASLFTAMVAVVSAFVSRARPLPPEQSSRSISEEEED